MDDSLTTIPCLFLHEGDVLTNSDCGNPFEQGYEVTHFITGPGHLWSIYCPCKPVLKYENPDNGSEFWVHTTYH